MINQLVIVQFNCYYQELVEVDQLIDQVQGLAPMLLCSHQSFLKFFVAQ